MKVLYVSGPGDVYGTFKAWKSGRADPRLLKQTYSGQFFDLIHELGAKGQIISAENGEPVSDERFCFSHVKRSRNSGVFYYLNELAYSWRVGLKIRQLSPDVIIVSSDFPSFGINLLPLKPYKILSIHNTFWRPYGRPPCVRSWLSKMVNSFSLRTTAAAVCVSYECQRQFQQLRGRRKTFTVIQIPRIQEALEVRRPLRPRRLLFVGRLEPEKGLEDLIRAFYKLYADYADLQLDIVGDGGALTEMKALVQQLGLEGAIDFKGRLDAQGVARSYSTSDLCICPTRWAFNEGLATVPLEAAAYGIPTVMSEAVPAKELFGAHAIRFEPGDVADLTEKLRHILANEEVYRQALEDARDSFAWSMQNLGDWKAGIRKCLDAFSLSYS